MLLTHYMSTDVWHTEYDAFCPTMRELDNGFWYLPDGQRNLPINPAAYQQMTGQPFIVPQVYLDCPCFQNFNSRPHDEIIDGMPIRYSSPDEAPIWPGGYPEQETLEKCWTRRPQYKKGNKIGWSYKPSGGHGRGASQYGLTYYSGFGYRYMALDRLFFKDAQIRILSSSIIDEQCKDVKLYDEIIENVKKY